MAAIGRIAEMLITRRTVIAAIWLLCLSSAAAAGEVDIGALLKESEEAVEKLDQGRDKAELLVTLATVHAKRGERKQALKILERAVQLATKLESSWDRDPVGLDAVGLQAKLGDVAGALRNVKALQLDVFGLGRVAQSQTEAGDLAGAWATCDQCDLVSGKTIAVNPVLGVLIEAGRFDAALRLIDQIDKLPEKIDDEKRAYCNRCRLGVASEQARHGQVKEALRTAERTGDDLANAETLQEIATIRLSSGDLLGAKEAVHRALPIFKRHSEFDSERLEELVAAQAETGDIPGAFETTAKFFNGPSRAYVLLRISIAQAKAGDRNAATRTFKEGLALVRAEKDDKRGFLGAIALRQAKAHDFDRALELVQLIGDRGEISREVAIELAKAGDVERALKTAASTPNDSGEQATAFCEIASVQAKSRQPSAKVTFERAVEVAMSNRNIAVAALRRIGQAQLQAGDVDAAAKTFDEARKRGLPSKFFSSDFEQIAEAQAAGGDARRALSWARSEPAQLPKARSLVGVIQGLSLGTGRANP
jgi:tetratricopeptide (TPR) repeat protein